MPHLFKCSQFFSYLAAMSFCTQFCILAQPNEDLSNKKIVPVTVPSIESKSGIVLDGNMDESAWKEATAFTDFIQTNPGNNVPPSQKTEAYLIYDEENLYVAFKCWDEKGKIRATIAKRDEISDEDNVRIWLDTYNDQRRAYVLGWNPLGIQSDAIYTEGQGFDYSVDIVMESKGAITDWGWIVEAKIPFKSLRYQSGKDKMWGFNASRNIARFNNESDDWMPLDRNIQGRLIQHGKITGFEGINSEKTLEIIPSITLSETGKRVPANEIPEGRFINQPVKKDLGLNLKYNISSNVVLDVAINPDFAEIDADEPVVTANQRFPIFFSEKRPFFLEGTEIFQSPIRIFHSRTIVDPDFAVKLTGKIKKTSLGFLIASDKSAGNYEEDSRNDPEVRPFIDEFLDKNAFFSVIRLKRDIGNENNLGFFGTARLFPEQRNFAGGFDGRFKFNSKTTFSFQTIISHTRKCFFNPFFDDIRNPQKAERNGEICGGAIVNGEQRLGDMYSEYRTGNGIAYRFEYRYSKDTFEYSFRANGQSKDYQTDVGFNRRTNTNDLAGTIRVSTKSKPKSSFVRLNWTNGFIYRYDWDRRFQLGEWWSNGNITLQKNNRINFWGGLTRQQIYEDEFGLGRLDNRQGEFFGEPDRTVNQAWFGGSYRSQPNKKLSFSMDIDVSFNAFDFDFGAGSRFPRVSPVALKNPNSPLDPGSGRRLSYGGSIELKPTDRLNLFFKYSRRNLIRNDTKSTAFDSQIYTFHSAYQFTRFVFTRVRWDYDTLTRNARGQMLFGWNPNPGTAIYFGYNDNFNYGGFNPFTKNHEPKFKRNSKTFFIRLSYLFRKSL